MDFTAYAAFFGVGSFVALTERILWITLFYIGAIMSCIGISCIPQSTVVEHTSSCTAGVGDYNLLYLLCFIAAFSAILQAFLATGAILIRGSERNINELEVVSSRRLVFASIIVLAMTSLCIMWIIDSVIFVRVARFHCLEGWRYAVVILDAIVGLAVLVFCLVSSFIALYWP